MAPDEDASMRRTEKRITAELSSPGQNFRKRGATGEPGLRLHVLEPTEGKALLVPSAGTVLLITDQSPFSDSVKRRKRPSSSSRSVEPSLPGHGVKSPLKWLMLICGAYAFVLYANTLHHGYALDDQTAIIQNRLTHAGISALPAIFTTPYRAGVDDRKEGLYRPLSLAFFAVEWQIAPGNPRLGHWVNVLLYVLTALMLFVALSLFLEKQHVLLPFIATLLFVAHPVHTEVVANIKSRDEILCLLFSLLALWAAVKYARQGGLIYLAAAGLSIFLALLSKETAVTMVVMAPLTVYFFQSSGIKHILISAVPFAVALAAYLSMRVLALGGLSNFEEISILNNSIVAAGSDPPTRLATAVSIVGRYLCLLVFPHPLSFDYSYNTIPVASWSEAAPLLSLASTILLAVIAFHGFKSRNTIAWAILFLGGTFSLTSNIFFLIEATLAERFLYMPSVGFSVAVSLLLARMCKINAESASYPSLPALIQAHKGILTVVTILAALYGVKTFSRNPVWKDNITLAATDVQTHPNSVRIRHGYGSPLVWEYGLKEADPNRKTKFLEQGIKHLTEAVRIFPRYGEAWFDLGIGYKELGDFKSAIICFENAMKHTGEERADYYVASGVAYGEDGQYQRALELLGKAIRLDSTSSAAYNNIGLFYSRAGNQTMSIQMLNRAIELDPKDDNPRYNMGNSYHALGDFTMAIEYYKQAIALNPVSEKAWLNLGNSYGALRDYSNALNAFKKVLEINPANAGARHNIGVTYYMMGDTAKARLYLPKN
jgi:tetratricopeptide (TPR) repeat protein